MIQKNNLFKEAIQLPPADRIKLIDAVYQSLDKLDPVIEASWLKESKRRYRAYKAGKMKAVSFEKAFGIKTP
jgi:putative addiction module component (TIGR02574 family)